MPRHLWHDFFLGTMRMCECCRVVQTERAGCWAPAVSTICPGDDDDDGARRSRPRPIGPVPSGKLLEVA